MLYYYILFLLLISSFAEILYGTELSLKKIRLYTDYLVFIALALILFSITAFRYKIGRDYDAYLRFFDHCLNNDDIYFEKGYVLVNKIFKLFSNDYYIMQVAITTIIWYFICKNIFRNSYLPCFTLLLYYLNNFFPTNLMQFRQFIAIGIVCFGVKFISEKKLINWILVVLLASFFHVTAFLVLPLSITTHLKIKKKTCFLLLLISLFINLFGRNLLFTTLDFVFHLLPNGRYANMLFKYVKVLDYSTATNFSSGLGFFTNYIFYIYLLLMYDEKEDDNIFILNFFIALIINSFARNLETLTRIAFYYNICGNGFCTYNLFCKKKYKMKYSALAMPVLYLLFKAYSFKKMISSPDKFGLTLINDVYPYTDCMTNTDWSECKTFIVLSIVSLIMFIYVFINIAKCKKKYFLTKAEKC